MYRIKCYGLGGQGVVTAAKILSHAASIFENKYGKTIPAFGHERRGAPVYADVMIDHEPILLNSFVYQPDVVLLFAPSVIQQGIQIQQGIHADSILIINTADPLLPGQLKQTYHFKEVYHVDASAIALAEIGLDIPNGAMLGAIARAGIVQIQSVISALKENFRAKEGEQNARAAQNAYERTRKE